jgi:hypothetical protein
LKSTPDDPLPLLGDLPKKYSVAARLLAANIPATLRQLAAGPVKLGADIQGAAPGEAFALAMQSQKKALASLLSTLDDLDEATLGLALDPTAQKSYLELTVTAKEGTKLAKQLAENADLKTAYSAFRLPGASVAMSWTQKASSEKIAENLAALKVIRERLPSELDKQGWSVLKQAADELLEVVEDTAKGGRSDGAVSVMLDTKAANLLGAISFTGADKLDKALHDLAAAAKTKDPDAAKGIKLDADKAGAVRFHVVSLPVPPEAENREKIVQAVGDTLDVALGVTEGTLYVAAGRDALATLKKTVEKSASDGPKPASLLSFSVSAGAVARFLAEVGDAQFRPIGVMLSALLAQKDQLNVVGTVIPRGAQFRVEAEDGVLKAIVTMGQMFSTLAGGRGAGF